MVPPALAIYIGLFSLIAGCNFKSSPIPAFPEADTAGETAANTAPIPGGQPTMSGDASIPIGNGQDATGPVMPDAAAPSGGQPAMGPKAGMVAAGGTSGSDERPMAGGINPDDHIFPSGPHIIAQLEMNDTVDDVSGLSNHARLIGMKDGRFVDTSFGRGLRVSDGYNTLDWQYNVGLSAPWTIEVVFTMSDFTANFVKLVGHDPESVQGIWLRSDLERIAFWTRLNQSDIAFSIGDYDWINQISYLAIRSVGNDRAEVFFNGQQLRSGSVTESRISDGLDLPNDRFFFFLEDAMLNVRRFEAVIDGIRISSTVRTDAEIRSVWERIQRR